MNTPTSNRSGKVAALLGLLLMLLARPGMAAPEARAGFPASHRAPALTTARPTGRHDGAKRLTLDLVLPLRHRPALNQLLRRLYDPQDPLYGHYLTPTQLAAQFGPAQADVDAVTAFAQAHGLAVQKVAANRTVVQVSGPARAVEDAFAVQINDYADETGRSFFGAGREPTVTSDVAGRLLGVLGLSNVGKPRAFSRRAPVSADVGASGLLNYATGIGGLSPADVQNIYGLAGIPDNGAGQVAGLFELGTYTASDIPAYFHQYRLPAIPVNPVSVDGYDTTSAPGGTSSEVTLDIDMIAALAPGVSQIRVYEATDQNTVSFPQLLHDSFTAMANDPQARPSVISVSYGFSELYAAPADFQTLEQATAILAAQGQSVCVASGDAGAYTYQDKSYGPNASFPATDPYVTCVGGTNLADGYNSGTGSVFYGSETSWFDPSDTGRGAIGTGGGGGVSDYWGIPSWQAGAFSTSVNPQGSTTNRNVPDVSLFGDYDTGGYSIYYTPPGGSGNWYGYNGTSAAAPLWAAFLADVDQARAAKGQAAIGLANPAIYRAAEGPDYAADFHDIADGSNNGFYNAVAGYDNSTGWGSFNGGGLLNDLAPSTAVSTTISVASVTGTPGQTVTLTGTLTNTATLAPIANEALSLTVNGAAAGTATTNTSGVATVTYTIPAALAAGPYPIAVSFGGDTDNGASSGSGTLTVTPTKVNTAVAVPGVSGIYGQTVTVNATLTNATTHAAIANKALTFSIDGTGVGTATSSVKGTATLAYAIPAGLTAGSHALAVTFAGDASNNPGSGTGTLKVSLAQTALSVPGVSGACGQTVTVNATLTNASSHAALADEALTFSVDGTGVGTAATSAKGLATLTYTLPATLTVGSHTLSVSFGGDAYDSPSSGTGTLQVSKVTTYLSAPGISGTAGQTVTLSGTLTANNSPLADEVLAFSVNGAAAGTATTNASGVATLPHTIPATLVAGKYPLAVSFAGDSLNSGTSKTTILTVNKVNTALAVANVTGTVGQAVTLSGTLTVGGGPLANETLAFTIDTTAVGTATTNTAGVATLPHTIPTTLAVGKHTITVTFAGDGNDNTSTGKGTLTRN